MHIFPTAAIVRRSAIEAAGGTFDERLSGYEDDDLFLAHLPGGLRQFIHRDPARTVGESRGLVVSFPNGTLSTDLCRKAARDVSRAPTDHRRALFRDGTPATLSRASFREPRLGVAILCEITLYLGRFPVGRRFVGYGALFARVLRGDTWTEESRARDMVDLAPVARIGHFRRNSAQQLVAKAAR